MEFEEPNFDLAYSKNGGIIESKKEFTSFKG
jgi:hypothetical protein